MNSFCNSFIDAGNVYLYGYECSKKGYLYRTVFVDGKFISRRRISEQDYISAYEEHINA